METKKHENRRLKLVTCITERRGEIVQQWRKSVYDDVTLSRATELTGPLLNDFIALLLDDIVEVLQQDIRSSQNRVKWHSKLRIATRQSMKEALAELAHLRATLFRICLQNSSDVRSSQMIHTVIDGAMAEVADKVIALGYGDEEGAWQSRERYRLVVDGIKDYAIFTTDIDGIINNWNPGVERILGYEEHEFVGQPAKMIFTHADQIAGAAEAEMATAVERGCAADKRWHQRKGGTLFWAEGVLQRLDDEAGRHIGFAKIMSDRTTQKSTEDALREIEERFRLVMENVGDLAIFVLDTEGKIRDWNVGSQRITGFNDQDIDGQAFHLLFTPEDIANKEPEKELRRARKLGRTENIRWHVRKDGSRFWAAGFTTALHDEDGDLKGYCKMERDITATKITDDALRFSEERLRLAVMRAPLTLFNCDKDLRYTWIASPYPGFISNNYVGKRLDDIFPIEGVVHILSFYQSVIDTEVGDRRVVSFPTPDQGVLKFDLTIEPMRDRNGTVIGLTGAALDITQRAHSRPQPSLTNGARAHLIDDISDVYHRVFYSSPSPQIILSTDFKVIAANEAYLKALRAEPGLVEGLNFLNVFPDHPSNVESAGNMHASLERVVKYCRPDAMAIQKYALPSDDLKTSKFEERYWSCINWPVLNLLGGVEAIVSGAEDVTDFVVMTRPCVNDGTETSQGITVRLQKIEAQVFQRAQILQRVNEQLRVSEERHRRSQERLRLTQEVAQISGWDWNIKTDEVTFSGATTEVFGRHPENYEDWWTGVHPDDKPALQAQIERVLKNEVEYDVEFRFLWPDGQIHWLMCKGQVIRDTKGEPERLVGIAMDFTAKKRTEERIKQSEKHFRQLAESMPEIIFTTTSDGHTDYINKKWTDFTGLSSEESFGSKWSAMFHPDERDRILSEWQNAVKAGRELIFEARIRGRDSEYRWHVCRASPIMDENGKIVRWFGTATDIDAFRRAEEESKRAKEAAESANRSKSAFLANMSHEIRTPLGVIIGYSELLREEGLSSTDRRKFVDTIARNGRELARLIDDILDLSKVEAGQVEIELLDVSLPTLLADVATSLSAKAQEKGISLVITPPQGAPPTIRTDATRLRQILLNIVGNAVKFTDKGSVLVTTDLVPSKGRRGQSQLVFKIKDTGPGLTQEQRSRLFRPFVQADSSTTRRFGGTGLGLILSKKLAQALGGDVAIADTTPGVGSTFVVTIDPGPIAPHAPTIDVTLSANSLVTDRDLPLHLDDVKDRLAGITVLLAEDAVDNQYLVKRVLTKAGAEVEIVENGAAAVNAAMTKNHDIILMDIQMPMLDGHDATEELRRRGYDKPIIALTAHAMREEKERSLRAGCNDHLTKPLNANRLLYTVALYTHRL